MTENNEFTKEFFWAYFEARSNEHINKHRRNRFRKRRAENQVRRLRKLLKGWLND